MAALIGSGSYEWPDGPWLRANMVSSVDGAAQGADGLSGTVNNEVDREAFSQLREGADALLVGAGTARAEGYRPADVPLVVVGHRLPLSLQGEDSVRLVPGGSAAELRALVDSLRAEGLSRILCEGGPSLLGDLVRAGLVDELCLTLTPRLLAGDGRRILAGPLVDVPLSLTSLVEQDGTLLTRWLVACRA
ncbi:dihydrofolate reductase family protein [Nocardioides sp.]|uniref:dihydrofolate reductase family protein n=1 Tax=Nocardioides sp. TaxID=35761 RepID=UPI0039E60303